MQPTEGHRDRSRRFAAAGLEAYACALLTAAGLEAGKAADVAAILVEGDLLGHDTHGLALLAAYLKEIESGSMRCTGEPEIVAQRGATETWDGRRLPGPWLTLRALERALGLAREYGTGTVAIRRSHHIACLEAYLRRATDQGFLALLMCSDPNAASVAPFGGTRALFTPNPLALGFPTQGDPVLIDISASLTTNAMTARLNRHGKEFPHAWLMDAAGRVTRDPAVLFNEPKGTILPLGGIEAGHKGFALALLVEALTAGLAGHGRADTRAGWGATVFLQAIDPAGFGGLEAMTRQMQFLVDACHANPPRAGQPCVRLPGEAALARRRRQLTEGVALHPDILPSLADWSAKWHIAPPALA